MILTSTLMITVIKNYCLLMICIIIMKDKLQKRNIKKKELEGKFNRDHCMKVDFKVASLMDMEEESKEMETTILENLNMEHIKVKELCMIKTVMKYRREFGDEFCSIFILISFTLNIFKIIIII